MKTRILEKGNCDITESYGSNHQAVDIVGANSTLDYVVAHSDGKVIFYQDGYDNLKGSVGDLSYGNCIKLEHGNGYETLYAHMKKGLSVKNGSIVKKGQRLGYMGDSGNAYGKHLHFEVWKDGKRINSTEYLDKDLYTVSSLKHKVGDKVIINGVYKTSNSEIKLNPLIKNGIITRIVDNAKNPYLLNNGNIGWVNDDSIISDTKYLINKDYNGNSIVDALNQINVDSSFDYRAKLANLNGINNYMGTVVQNVIMLNKLKEGSLISL